jgi:RNA polymerase sigma-70 factor (sigma-E family)
MKTDLGGPLTPARVTGGTGPPGEEHPAAGPAVTALYQAHALGLIRLAHIMLGDRPSAEDVVQEAFCGLYRRWAHLSDSQKALRYLRSSVLNGCRSLLRRRGRREPAAAGYLPPGVSAESAAVTAEERREVMRALRRLPQRQREALVLRFYFDLPDEEIAATMGIGQSTVRSAAHRGLRSLGRVLEELS